jgi:hypothetical protein
MAAGFPCQLPRTSRILPETIFAEFAEQGRRILYLLTGNERSQEMKLGILLPVLCAGIIILTLVTLYQTREPDTDKSGPFRRRVLVEENRGPISRLMSKIVSFFKSRPVILEEEVEIIKDIPRGISFDCLSNKSLDLMVIRQEKSPVK